MSKIYFFYITFLIFIYSCSYSPDGENFVIVENIDTFNQVINLNEVESDTIYLPVKSDFTYTVSGEYLSESYVDVIFGGEELSSHYRDKNEFNINPSIYSSGNYSLKIEINTKKAIGTLADALNSAGYTKTVWKQYVVVIYNELPENAEILSVDTIDHQLRVRWQKFDNFTFQKYIITKYTSPTPDPDDFIFDRRFEIFDKHVSELIDSSFLFGNVSYQLSIQTFNGAKEGSRSEIFTFIDSTELVWKIVDNYKVSFTWDKPILYNNLDKYFLDLPLGNDQIEISDPNDTTYLYNKNLPFGYEGLVYIKAIPKNRPGNSSLMIDSKYVFVGDRIDHFTYIFYDRNSQSLFGYKGGYENEIFKVDDNLSEMDSFNSTNGKLLSSYDRAYNYFFFEPGIFKGFDMYSMSYSGADHNIQNIVGLGNDAIVENISISNNGLLACEYASFNFVIDLKTEEILLKKNHDGEIKISPDGDILVCNDSIFQFTGSYYNYISDLGINPGYFGWTFLEGENQYIIAIYSYRIDFINPVDGSIEKSFTNTFGSTKFQIDRSNNQICLYNNKRIDKTKYLHILDLDNGEILHEVQIMDVAEQFSHIYSFANDHIISSFRDALISPYGYHINLNKL